MCLRNNNQEAENEIIDAKHNATCEEDIDDLINVLENQLDELYHFHKFKLDGRKPTLLN